MLATEHLRHEPDWRHNQSLIDDFAYLNRTTPPKLSHLRKTQSAGYTPLVQIQERLAEASDKSL